LCSIEHCLLGAELLRLTGGSDACALAWYCSSFAAPPVATAMV
jgi:hypothetical protein